MKDIEIVDIDYSAKNPEYKKEDKVIVANISGPFIVPEEGPIFGDNSLRLLRGGIDLIRGTDWVPVEGVTKLSELTGKPVYLYIELKNHIVTSGGELDLIYQRVGKPVISVKTLMTMLEDMVIKGKPVDWETQITGKPDTYYPAWHSHDIKNPNELVGFGGLVQLFSSLTWSAQRDGPKIAKLLSDLQDKMFNDLDYTQKLLWGAIMGHSRNYKNPHMLKPSDVDLGNVANNATATPQQDSDGSRSDLFSTPAGLARVIEESAPESEDFLMQSELPFGYYGSGIYLPPPITGSFEGLGGDIENSVFTVEGNGWLVGLVRAYDGRVKNLYYTYCMDYKDRDYNRSPWLNTYVQYQHPTIQAAGKQANTAICGSNGQVLMIGDQQEPNSDITGTGNWWICASNSTFDPNSHNLKPVNMDSIINDMVTLCERSTRPGNFNLSYVGEWVYLFATPASFVGDDSGTPNSAYDNAWQTFMWRVPYKDLNDDSKTSIMFTRVNVTYDTLLRERRTNKNSFIPQKYVFNTQGNITACAVKFSPYATETYINRKKAFIIVPNPNNSRLARVKLIIAPFSTYVDPATNAPRAYGSPVIINYEWDVVSNTWTIDPNWDMPTVNMLVGDWLNATQKQKDYSIANTWWEGIAVGYVNTAGSWIPGFGYIVMRAEQAGPPPYTFRLMQVNRDGVIDKDYTYMTYPNDWNSPAGLYNGWQVPFKMKSPFGIAGFPRLYSDLYSLTTGVRQSPIEIFAAENENQRQEIFYRVTEGGADDNYDNRPALQSSFIPKPIYGRKTNSNFGSVSGLDFGMGYSNRPKRKNATSREVGLFLMSRVNIQNNPGAGYNFSLKTGENGAIEYIKMENDGSVVINLDLDYTLDPIAKVITARPNKAKQVRIPKSFYIDAMYTAMGADASKVIDLVGSYYISSTPGTGQDQAYSMWQVVYHTIDAPTDAKMIVGMFTWEVASVGADGIRVMRPTNMQYPFTSQHTQNQLRPGSPNNTLISNYFTVRSDLTWASVLINFGLQVRQQHMEIYDYESEGPQNMEMAWFPGWQIEIPGNGTSSRMFMKRRNNQIVEATVGVRPQQAFNGEYDWVLSANPQWGWLRGVDPAVSGAAMDLMAPWNGPRSDWGVVEDKYIMYGATYVEGNWSVFVNADILVTFNGYAMIAKQTNWDLRDLTDIYKNQTFYIYCEAVGSTAQYDITKNLRNHSTSSILVGIIKTDDFGIVTIDRRQSFSISGFPLTRTRDMGVPVSSGAITEQGTYKFLKRSELYND